MSDWTLGIIPNKIQWITKVFANLYICLRCYWVVECQPVTKWQVIKIYFLSEMLLIAKRFSWKDSRTCQHHIFRNMFDWLANSTVHLFILGRNITHTLHPYPQCGHIVALCSIFPHLNHHKTTSSLNHLEDPDKKAKCIIPECEDC